MSDLVVDGDDLMVELSVPPSPRLGAILRELLAHAIADPSVNTRPQLMAIARSMVKAVRTDAS